MFDVLHASTGIRYADGDDIRLVNLAAIAFFSDYKVTTSSGKHLEETIHAHIVSLMSKRITSSKDSDNLSIGFDWDRDRWQRELTDNENTKRKYHLAMYLKDNFGFVEHQKKLFLGSVTNWH